MGRAREQVSGRPVLAETQRPPSPARFVRPEGPVGTRHTLEGAARAVCEVSHVPVTEPFSTELVLRLN